MQFELVQSDLETVTEMLSDVVARKHLRASHTQIVQATRAARSKRLEMEACLINFVLYPGEDSAITYTTRRGPSLLPSSHAHSFSMRRQQESRAEDITRLLAALDSSNISTARALQANMERNEAGARDEIGATTTPTASRQGSSRGFAGMLAGAFGRSRREDASPTPSNPDSMVLADERTSQWPSEQFPTPIPSPSARRPQPALATTVFARPQNMDVDSSHESRSGYDIDEASLLANEEDEINRAILMSLRDIPAPAYAPASAEVRGATGVASEIGASAGARSAGITRTTFDFYEVFGGLAHINPDDETVVIPFVEEDVQALVGLGFSRIKAEAALRASGHNVDAAANILFSSL